MESSIFFLVLTIILFVGTSVILYFRPDEEFKAEKPQDPLLFVVGVQERRDRVPGTGVPVTFPRPEDQVLVKKQLLVYGESMPDVESG